MRLRFIAGVLLLCCGAGACAQTGSVAEQYLFQAANAERAARGVPALRWDSALYRAAYGHVQQMAARASISHQYPGELELAARGKTAGARFSLIEENVAEAQTAVLIHNAWMNSPGHRANLLDPNVNAVGISVMRRDGQLYAVQDFERSVMSLSLQQQEQTVAMLVEATGPVTIMPAMEDARRTCGMSTGFSGPRQPTFVMRYTSADLQKIPDTLRVRVASGKYREAAIGACAVAANEPFATYSIAVMLFP
jgi:hypothetical protein